MGLQKHTLDLRDPHRRSLSESAVACCALDWVLGVDDSSSIFRNRMADGLLEPNLEGDGLPSLEAMARNRPVVATATGISAELQGIDTKIP